MSNLTEHKCAGKCPEFKGEQCHHCLIPGNSEISNSSDFIMGDDAHIENHISPNCKTSNYGSSDAQIIAELKAENEMLLQAAATHLRNQNHYMDLYHRLIEQLYPYAVDLAEPMDGSDYIGKNYRNGYNRARECASVNLLEMMESDIEYIRAQCGMLGGGGEAV